MNASIESRAAGIGFILAVLLVFRTAAVDVTVSVPAGLSLVGNPLLSGETNIAKIIQSPPEGLQVIKFHYDRQHYFINEYQFGNWTDPAQGLGPGESVYVWNPGKAFQIYLSGEAPVVSEFFPKIGPGLNFIAVKSAEELTSIAVDMDSLYRMVDGRLVLYHFDFGDWFPALPAFLPGEGLILRRSGTAPAAECTGGVVYFNNYQPGLVNERVLISGCNVVDAESGWKAELALVSGLGTLAPLGGGLPFLSGEKAGYFDVSGGAVLCIPGVSPGMQVDLRVRMSQDVTGPIGESPTFRVTVGGDVSPPAAITGFSLNLITLGGGGSPDLSPQKLEVIEGQAAQFQGFASPPPYQWQKEALDGTWVDIAGETNSVLAIPTASQEDAGRYRMTWVYVCARETNPAELIVRRRIVLLNAALSAGGEFSFSFESQATHTYVIEASEDLVTWTSVKTVERPTGPVPFTTDSTPPNRRKFYRVIES